MFATRQPYVSRRSLFVKKSELVEQKSVLYSRALSSTIRLYSLINAFSNNRTMRMKASRCGATCNGSSDWKKFLAKVP